MNKFKENAFERRLTGPLEKKLLELTKTPTSWLSRWLSCEKQRPLLAIRNKYANLYVDGCAFKLCGGDGQLVFDANYLKRETGLKNTLNKISEPGTEYKIASSDLTESLVQDIVGAALEYQAKGKRSKDKERPLATRALQQYAYSLDCEIGFPAISVNRAAISMLQQYESEGKALPQYYFDLQYKERSSKKPDALLLSMSPKPTLRFFEIKEASNKEWSGDNPAVIHQARFYDCLLRNDKDSLCAAYKYVLRLFMKLGKHHAHFAPFASLDPESIDLLALDPFHDIVVIGDITEAQRYDLEEKVKMQSVANAPHRRRVHVSSNAGDWLRS